MMVSKSPSVITRRRVDFKISTFYLFSKTIKGESILFSIKKFWISSETVQNSKQLEKILQLDSLISFTNKNFVSWRGNRLQDGLLPLKERKSYLVAIKLNGSNEKGRGNQEPCL